MEVVMNKAIGVFDSGVGGLTVLSSLQKQLPNETFIYIGDNKNSPYGDKTKEQLLSYAKRIIEYFIQKDVKMVTFACNTTTANVLDDLRVLYPDMLLVGVIDSTITSYLTTNSKSTLVIATNATIRCGAYEKEIVLRNKERQVYSLATPCLVPLIESGEYRKGIHKELINYLAPYQDKVDSIILGCTHYPIIANQIQELYPMLHQISSSDSIVYEVKELLQRKRINATTKGAVKIYTTGNVKEFMFSSISFYDYQNCDVKHLDI